MAEPSQSVLMIGATGWIGKYILEELIKSNKFERLAILTSENTVETKSSQIESLKSRGVEIITGDVAKSEDISKAFQDNFDTVVSAVGRNMIAQQIDWIHLAAKTPNIKRFLPSEFGTDIEHGPESATEIPHQQKLKVRAALRSAQGSLDYTYIVTGPYCDIPGFFNCLPPDLGTKIGTWDVKNKSAVILGDGNGKIGFSTNQDVGRFVVAALLHPTESKNRALKVNSFVATPLEILAEFEKQTGGEKWSVSKVPLEELREKEQQAWKDKEPSATGFTLRRIWTEGGTAINGRDNEVVGVTGTDSLETAVKNAVQEQLKE